MTYSKSLFSSEGPKEVCYKNVLCFLKRSKCPQKIQHLLVPSEFLRFPQVTLYLPNFSEHKKNHESILLATQNCFNQYNIYSCATRTIFCQHVFLFCATLNMFSRHSVFGLSVFSVMSVCFHSRQLHDQS